MRRGGRLLATELPLSEVDDQVPEDEGKRRGAMQWGGHKKINVETGGSKKENV